MWPILWRTSPPFHGLFLFMPLFNQKGSMFLWVTVGFDYVALFPILAFSSVSLFCLASICIYIHLRSSCLGFFLKTKTFCSRSKVQPLWDFCFAFWFCWSTSLFFCRIFGRMVVIISWTSYFLMFIYRHWLCCFSFIPLFEKKDSFFCKFVFSQLCATKKVRCFCGWLLCSIVLHCFQHLYFPVCLFSLAFICICFLILLKQILFFYLIFGQEKAHIFLQVRLLTFILFRLLQYHGRRRCLKARANIHLFCLVSFFR